MKWFGRWLKLIGQKLGINSGQAIVHVVVIEVIANFIWDKVTQMTDLPYIREIGFLIIILACLVLVGWYFPKLTLQLARVSSSGNKPVIAQPRLEYDGVLWEDGGNDRWGYMVVIGPLCPKDLTRLGFIKNDKVDMQLSFSKTISNSEDHNKLYCPACKNIYTLGEKTKTLQNSYDEVMSILGGKRRYKYTR